MADNGFPVAQGGQEQDTSSALTTTDSSQSKDLVAQNTESIPAVGADEDVDTSKTSSIKGFFKDGEMVHRLIILGFLVIFVAAIIFAVISFSSSGKSPESERKLGQYSTQDIGSVLDFLENEGYKYRLSGNLSLIHI